MVQKRSLTPFDQLPIEQNEIIKGNADVFLREVFSIIHVSPGDFVGGYCEKSSPINPVDGTTGTALLHCENGRTAKFVNFKLQVSLAGGN